MKTLRLVSIAAMLASVAAGGELLDQPGEELLTQVIDVSPTDVGHRIWAFRTADLLIEVELGYDQSFRLATSDEPDRISTGRWSIVKDRVVLELALPQGASRPLTEFEVHRSGRSLILVIWAHANEVVTDRYQHGAYFFAMPSYKPELLPKPWAQPNSWLYQSPTLFSDHDDVMKAITGLRAGRSQWTHVSRTKVELSLAPSTPYAQQRMYGLRLSPGGDGEGALPELTHWGPRAR